MARGEAAFGGNDPDGVDAGDELAALYTHHGAAVRRLCRVLLRNGHEAEDAAQQVFLSAYRSLLSGTVPRHPAAWLATITRNECVLRIQRRMREPLPVGEADETIPDPVMTAAERADLGELWRAIAGLPHKQREALVLRESPGFRTPSWLRRSPYRSRRSSRSWFAHGVRCGAGCNRRTDRSPASSRSWRSATCSRD